MASRKKKKVETPRKSGFDHKYSVLGILIIIVAAIGIIAIWMVTPKFSDNVAAEFGEYTSGLGYGNNYFAGACSEGSFTTRFYTMSGVSGRLTKIVIPIEVYDDPDAEVTAVVKMCEATLGGNCIGDEVAVTPLLDFNYWWGLDSGEKEIDVETTFFVRAGAYYKITIEGTMEKYITYSMYKADVPAGVNRYFHSAPGCSSNRPDVYVIYFWAV